MNSYRKKEGNGEEKATLILTRIPEATKLMLDSIWCLECAYYWLHEKFISINHFLYYLIVPATHNQ